MIKINNKILWKTHNTAKNHFQKAAGLMFKSNVTQPLLFIFKKESLIPLHMWFVFTPIDVLFLNQNKIIVEIKEDFRPFSYYSPKNKAQFILELPKNSISQHNIKLNQQVHF